MTQKALLVVDVQNDFCPGGALAVPYGDEVVAPLNKAIEHAQRNGWIILASRDWHPPATSHFKLHGGVWPVHCLQNTYGAEFHPQLLLPQETTVVSKGYKPDEDGYSAFDGTTASGEPLFNFLDKREVQKIFIGGLATDYCVKASAIDALRRGFETFLLFDACRAVNLKEEDGIAALEEMARAGVILTTTDTLETFQKQA